MIFPEKQLEYFNQLKLEKFVALTLDFLKKNLPTLVADKDDEQLRNYIRKIIEWAKKYEVYSGLNLQKLVYHKIVFGWEIPLNEKLEAHLEKFSMHEDYRVEIFCLEVASGRYKLIKITLETSLNM